MKDDDLVYAAWDDEPIQCRIVRMTQPFYMARDMVLVEILDSEGDGVDFLIPLEDVHPSFEVCELICKIHHQRDNIRRLSDEFLSEMARTPRMMDANAKLANLISEVETLKEDLRPIA